MPFIDGILPKRPYPPCLCMADRALLAGYPRYVNVMLQNIDRNKEKYKRNILWQIYKGYLDIFLYFITYIFYLYTLYIIMSVIYIIFL